MLNKTEIEQNENLEKIGFKTPKGYRCKGYICRQPNETLGSLIITEIDKQETYQFIHGMPKIHYYKKYINTLKQETENPIAELREKLDGTNICLYKIHHPENENQIIDILTKSRNMPTLHIKFQRIYGEIKNPELEKHFQENPNLHTLIFELWGKENYHQIQYKEPKKLSLLCAYNKQHQLLQINQLQNIIKTYKLDTPETLGEIIKTNNNYKATIYPNKQKNKTQETKETIYTGTLEQTLEQIENHYEKINKKYKEENQTYNTEGLILNTKIKHQNKLMKLKPPSIAEKQKLMRGIPVHAIQKEIKKYKDEHGKETLENKYQNQQEEIIQYIQKQLEEEYKKEYTELNQTQKRIKRLIKEELQEKVSKSEIHSIAEDIKDENPNKELKELMKIFGQEYPEYKHKSKDIYNILKNME